MTHSEASNHAVAQPLSSIPLRYYAFIFKVLERKSSLVFQRFNRAFLEQLSCHLRCFSPRHTQDLSSEALFIRVKCV
jgi:hypothetical protein